MEINNLFPNRNIKIHQSQGFGNEHPSLTMITYFEINQ